MVESMVHELILVRPFRPRNTSNMVAGFPYQKAVFSLIYLCSMSHTGIALMVSTFLILYDDVFVWQHLRVQLMRQHISSKLLEMRGRGKNLQLAVILWNWQQQGPTPGAVDGGVPF